MAEEHYPSESDKRIAFWQDQLKASQEFFEPYMKAGKRMVRLYNNMSTTGREDELEWADQGDDENNMRVKASLVFAWVDQSVANMLERNPVFNVGPGNSIASEGAPVVGKAINYWYNETGQYAQDRHMALDAHLLPFAVKKIGWNAVLEHQSDVYFGDVSDIVIDDVDEENQSLFEGVITRPIVNQKHDEHIGGHKELIASPGLDSETIQIVENHIKHHEELKSLEQPVMDTTVKWESPFGTRWQPDDFLMDPYASEGLTDARWIAFRIRQPLHWWKSNPNFSNLSKLKPNATLSIDKAPKGKLGSLSFIRNSRKKGGEFEDFCMVEGWEIWARDFPINDRDKRNMLITIPDGHDQMAQHEVDWPYDNIEDYPAALLNFTTNVKTFINKPILTLAGADNVQVLMNEFLDSMLYTMRKSKNLWIYDTNVFPDKSKIENMLNAPDGSVFGVENLQQFSSGSSPIIAMPFQQIPQDKEQFLNTIQNFLDRTAGTPQPQRNITAETATESSIIEKRNNAREAARANLFQEMQVETARKFWQLHQQYRPERQFLIDPRADDWAAVSEDIAKGEYNFRIDVAPRQASMAVERKNLLDLFNLLVGTIPAFLNLQLPPPNIAKALELLLRRGYDIQDPETLVPAAASDVQKALESLSDDPEKLQKAINAFQGLAGGGDIGPAGQSPGPANPQQFAAGANAPVRQDSEAQNLG
jgi:hypothetical protein